MSDSSKRDSSGGIGDNIWVLIPLFALSIPILAITRESEGMMWIVGVVAVIATLATAIGVLMSHRSKLRIAEMEAQERIVQAERDQLSAAERLLEKDSTLEDLRRATQRPTETETN